MVKWFYFVVIDLRHTGVTVSLCLRVNITIVYEHTVCATSAFSMCMLRIVCNVILNDVATFKILLCLFLHNYRIRSN